MKKLHFHINMILVKTIPNAFHKLFSREFYFEQCHIFILIVLQQYYAVLECTMIFILSSFSAVLVQILWC